MRSYSSKRILGVFSLLTNNENFPLERSYTTSSDMHGVLLFFREGGRLRTTVTNGTTQKAPLCTPRHHKMHACMRACKLTWMFACHASWHSTSYKVTIIFHAGRPFLQVLLPKSCVAPLGASTTTENLVDASSAGGV
jgi:hypothetical protein